MPSKPKYYWDACAWIALIKREAGRFDSCRHTIELAEAGKVELWTSAFTLAEVYKRRVDGAEIALEADKDKDFEDYIEKDFVFVVQVDVDVGTAARRLLRAYPQIGKPQDAVHVATSLLNDVDELHTFDREDLLGLSGALTRSDGQKLKICPPPAPPPPEPKTPDLFDLQEKTDEPAKEQAQG